MNFYDTRFHNSFYVTCHIMSVQTSYSGFITYSNLSTARKIQVQGIFN